MPILLFCILFCGTVFYLSCDKENGNSPDSEYKINLYTVTTPESGKVYRQMDIEVDSLDGRVTFAGTFDNGLPNEIKYAFYQSKDELSLYMLEYKNQIPYCMYIYDNSTKAKANAIIIFRQTSETSAIFLLYEYDWTQKNGLLKKAINFQKDNVGFKYTDLTTNQLDSAISKPKNSITDYTSLFKYHNQNIVSDIFSWLNQQNDYEQIFTGAEKSAQIHPIAVIVAGVAIYTVINAVLDRSTQAITEGETNESASKSDFWQWINENFNVNDADATEIDMKLFYTDTDKDGVCDALDKCPDTQSNIKVTANGCKLITPTKIEIVSGNNQTGKLGKALAEPIKVIVKDTLNNPISGIKVTFTANNDGSVSLAQVFTESDGTASVNWTLGATDEKQTLNVTAYKSDNTTPLQGSPLTFTALIAKYQLTIFSGDSQIGDYGETLDAPIQVIVKDIENKPVAGIKVNFQVNNGGTISSTQVTTSVDGIASVTWTLGAIDETQTVVASAYESDNITPMKGSPATFTVNVRNQSLSISTGNDQVGDFGKLLANPIIVAVNNDIGDPVSGVKVNFVANNGGTVSQTQVTTGSDGKASVSWTLGPTDKKQTLTATAFKRDNISPLHGSPLTINAFTEEKPYRISRFGYYPCDAKGNIIEDESTVYLYEYNTEGRQSRVTVYGDSYDITYSDNKVFITNPSDPEDSSEGLINSFGYITYIDAYDVWDYDSGGYLVKWGYPNEYLYSYTIVDGNVTKCIDNSIYDKNQSTFYFTYSNQLNKDNLPLAYIETDLEQTFIAHQGKPSKNLISDIKVYYQSFGGEYAIPLTLSKEINYTYEYNALGQVSKIILKGKKLDFNSLIWDFATKEYKFTNLVWNPVNIEMTFDYVQ